SPAGSLSAWREKHFNPQELEIPEISGETADPNGNGVPNLMEYALNRDPRAPGRDGLPEPGTVELEGERFLTLTYSRPAGVQDDIYEPEVSTNLRDWQGGPEHVVPVSVTPNGETEEVVVRDARPLGNG